MSLEIEVSGREALADWLETVLLCQGVRPLGMDAINALAHSQTSSGLAQVNLAVRAMAARGRVLGADYPFTVNEVAVRARPAAASTTYTALLMLSSGSIARQLFHPVPTDEMVVLFENISARALAKLWGPSGRALRFGWPSDCGRPADFPSAVVWLADQLGVKPGSGYRPPRRKDGGVDVVAWRPFADARPGFPIMLAQCTLQSELMSKSADVDVRLWASWLALDFEPITALVIPGTVPDRLAWDQLALRCMVFDRLRLCALDGGSDELIRADDGLGEVDINEEAGWVQQTLTQVGRAMEESL